MTEKETAESVINKIAKKRSKYNVFRGQKSAKWKLVPSIFRHKELYQPKEGEENLQKIININKKAQSSFLQNVSIFYRICIERGMEIPSVDEQLHRALLNISTNKFGTYDSTQITTLIPSMYWPIASTMQHLGFETPMLDWTSNPLVALYFACESGEENEDAALWTLKTSHTEEMFLNSHVIDDHRIHFDQSLRSIHESLQSKRKSNCGFYLYRPQFTKESRIVAQSGWLSAFGITFQTKEGYNEGDFNSIEDAFDLNHISNIYATQTNQPHEKILSKTIIPSNLKESILYNLWDYGIHQLSVYPGLSHIVEFTQQYKVHSALDTIYEMPTDLLEKTKHKTD